MRHFGGDGPWHDIERQLDSGEMTLRAALALEASYVRATLDDADVLLRERVRIDPSFASFVAFCETREYPLTVVSSGIQPLIERALERVGLGRLTVVANPVTPSLDGWRMDFRDDSDNGNDKAALVAAASGAGFATVFVGDGRSDYGAALAADRRFAKRGRQLEAYLRERDVPFEPFTTFADVTAAMRAAA